MIDELFRALDANKDWFEAVEQGNTELIVAMLARGADVNAGDLSKTSALMTVVKNRRVDYFGTILMNAAELGYSEMDDLLLDRGANTEGTDDLGQTALIVAADAGRLEIVTLLVDRGAKIDTVDWCAGSALAHAAIQNRLDVVALLLSRGADRGIADAVALNDEALVIKL